MNLRLHQATIYFTWPRIKQAACIKVSNQGIDRLKEYLSPKISTESVDLDRTNLL